jgi:ElaB/YqjD/DUF883 family membrane-anchored ribosome-binding protein
VETEIRGRVESKMEKHQDKVDKAKAVLEQVADQSGQIREDAKEKFDGFVKDKKMDELTVTVETEIRGRVESKMEKHQDKVDKAKAVMKKVGSAIPTVDQETQIRQEMTKKFAGFVKALIFDKMKNLVGQVIKTIDQVLDVAVQTNDRIRSQADSNPEDLRDEIYNTIEDMYGQMDKRIALEVQGVIGVLGGIMQAEEEGGDEDEED